MAIENFTTFQNILDGILIKTLESTQNFPEEDRIVGINEEYLFLHTLINSYNVGKEWTAVDTDNNFYDQTLTAGDTEIPQTKEGVIRKIEYQLTGESTWNKVNRTSVRAYEAECGSLSEALALVTTPKYFIERDGNVEFIGELNVDATVRIWISDDMTLLGSTNKADEPRLPLFARVLLVLSPTLEYMDRHNMIGITKYNERYILVLNQLKDWAKQTAPTKTLKMKSVRRR